MGTSIQNAWAGGIGQLWLPVLLSQLLPWLSSSSQALSPPLKLHFFLDEGWGRKAAEWCPKTSISSPRLRGGQSRHAFLPHCFRTSLAVTPPLWALSALPFPQPLIKTAGCRQSKILPHPAPLWRSQLRRQCLTAGRAPCCHLIKRRTVLCVREGNFSSYRQSILNWTHVFPMIWDFTGRFAPRRISDLVVVGRQSLVLWWKRERSLTKFVCKDGKIH